MIIKDIQSRIIKAQKERDTVSLGVLRFLLSNIKNQEIELRRQQKEMQDKHVLKVIQKQIKQRNDSIEAYKQGNRDDLVQKESTELEILTNLLAEYSDEE